MSGSSPLPDQTIESLPARARESAPTSLNAIHRHYHLLKSGEIHCGSGRERRGATV